MKEALPLATVHDAILEFLKHRNDAVLFGAYAVNAYTIEPRMTQDVDILCARAEALAEELCMHLHSAFNIAVRTRMVAGGSGFRIYQVRKPANRHLADIRSVAVLPAYQHKDDIAVLAPEELIRMKIVSASSRAKTAKGLIDTADLQRLLLVFPELKMAKGIITDLLQASGVAPEALHLWYDLVEQEIVADDDDSEFQ